jgi:hypothetical protein
LEGEHLVAEQHVALAEHRTWRVRISQHVAEQYWRVQVGAPSTSRGTLSTTVSHGDNFLMNLIEEAISGQPSAWHHLAQWGRTALTRPATGFRTPPF